MDAPSSPSGPPYWDIITWAIFALGSLMFTGYCNLFSVTGLDRDPARIDRYLDAVRRQCLQYEELLEPYGTVFSEVVIGGGTPLLLTEVQLMRLFRLLEVHAACADGRELVIETAPNETVRSKLEILKAAGRYKSQYGDPEFFR